MQVIKKIFGMINKWVLQQCNGESYKKIEKLTSGGEVGQGGSIFGTQE